jgi:hypothetical protein
MNFFGRNLQGPAKVIVIFAAIFLVSAGMCGIQVVLVSHSSRSDNLASVLMVPGILELLAMAVSLVGIGIVLVAWAIGAVTRQFADKPRLGQPPSSESSHSDGPADLQPPNDTNGNP